MAFSLYAATIPSCCQILTALAADGTVEVVPVPGTGG